MNQVKIVTDSGCDLGNSLLADYEVEMLPISVEIGGQEYKDRVDIEPKEFYNQLEQTEGLPVTSQITPYVFREKFTDLLASNEQLIYISFSSQLSGIYNSVQVAQNAVDSERITVIDSKAASGGHGLLVVKAAELAQDNKSAVEITAAVKEMRDNLEHIFRVGSLEMLKKGGRISSTKALIGSLLNINPILEVNKAGEIVPLTKVRGKKKALQYLAEAVSEEAENLAEQRIGISHANALPLAEELAAEIRSRQEVGDILITEIGAAIGSHAGPGTVALFYQS